MDILIKELNLFERVKEYFNYENTVKKATN